MLEIWNNHKESIIKAGLLVILGIVFITVVVYRSGNSASSDGTVITKNYNTTVIDGCEYLIFESGFGQSSTMSVVHKGNCKNHKSN